ncbi:cytosol aminopeptidase-like [Mya arenaria]|uniref:cytosol aminopeptidase-like n=1 Tax=Mya arenaria TaxID=6604 RepID=UPI0022E1E11D|nr:cytosol aminopeptidase-like [Mya arenaria]
MAAPLKIMNVCKKCSKFRSIHRCFSTNVYLNKGLVLGVYEAETKGDPVDVASSPSAAYFNKQTDGQLASVLKLATCNLKKGGSRVLYGVVPGYDITAVCCLGKRGTRYSKQEGFEEGWENIRAAVAGGVRALRSVGETQVDVDPCLMAEAAAEGGHLALFEYDELKNPEKRKKRVSLACLTQHMTASDPASVENVSSLWQRGCGKAEGQNLARHLMEAPSNKLTPRAFTELVQAKFANRPNVKVTVRDRAWIEGEKMGAFLSVAQGSREPPYFLEIVYKHPQCTMEKPIALVGKGITFDTGGISIKPSASMDLMRADMGGAACVVGSLLAVDRLGTNTFVHAFIPLCENMPGGAAIKPGDVVTARNGKSIQIDNTDAEGRLILADALSYAETVNPCLILDMATLTGAIDVALGSAATGVFAKSTETFNTLQKAGSRTGDRMWRMPLFSHYSGQVTDCQLADVNNVGKYSRSGGSCTAAAFLKEFVTHEDWLHLDIAGVMSNKDEVPYLGKGMAGRPTRTIVEFIHMISSS